jgi:hypothetical protein
LYHFHELVSAIDYLAAASMPAAKLKILNLVVFYIQQADQCDLFFLALRFGVLQQRDGIEPFDKPLSREKSDMIKIIISQAAWVAADHGVITPVHMRVSGDIS